MLRARVGLPAAEWARVPRTRARLPRCAFAALALMTTTHVAEADDQNGQLEGSLRAGGTVMDYNYGGEVCPGTPTDYSGAGWFIDGELGWRYHDWTFSGFLSYLHHHDVMGPSQGAPWDVDIQAIEFGLRATWHHGPLSLGAGLMPAVAVHQSGTETVYFVAGNGATTLGASEADGLIGAELHAGYDVWNTGRLRMQLFALVEAAVTPGPPPDDGNEGNGNWTLTSLRLGVGMTY
jgi:hypothetical protein